MKNILISVIVPVYKVEEYIKECLESIIKQTYENIEIIIIDDGSPDESGAIAEEYALKDKRIKVFHKENGGVSDTRNFGIVQASGEYVTFVDSDDYVSTNTLYELMKLITEYDADIAVCKNDLVGMPFKKNPSIENKVSVFTTLEALERLYISDGNMGTPWGKIYKKELFAGLKFPKGRLSDDDATIYKIIYNAKKIVLTNNKLYHYRIHENSITNASFSLKNLDYLIAMEERMDFFKSRKLNILYYKTMAFYGTLIIKFYFEIYKSDLQDKQAQLSNLIEKFKHIKEAVLKSRHTKIKQKLVFFVFGLEPKILMAVMRAFA
ncbi:MAG: glycosyltransferase [bacterium]